MRDLNIVLGSTVEDLLFTFALFVSHSLLAGEIEQFSTWKFQPSLLVSKARIMINEKGHSRAVRTADQIQHPGQPYEVLGQIFLLNKVI